MEKNDLSPHSATKTKTKVLMTVLAAAKIPAPFPENFETASSACITKKNRYDLGTGKEYRQHKRNLNE